MRKLKIKFPVFEFWPFWFFYAPFVPYWIWKSIQLKSFSYFCKVNPGIRFGGFLEYSKFEILKQIPEEFKPKTQFISLKKGSENLPNFPFILKPDFGERGKNVELIQNENDWNNYPLQKNLILQEFIDFPLEFGVFYARIPNHKSGKILSITGKKFLIFQSNGKTTLRAFINQNPRAEKRKIYLELKFKNQLDIILPKGNKILLEPIGNHNRGTQFLDKSELISEKLTIEIDKIAQNIKGFYYGRFDVKTQSIENLRNGKFIILEINGANSEPTHVYDSKFNLMQAYREVKKHFDVQFEIAKENKNTKISRDFYRSVLRRIF